MFSEPHLTLHCIFMYGQAQIRNQVCVYCFFFLVFFSVQVQHDPNVITFTSNYAGSPVVVFFHDSWNPDISKNLLRIPSLIFILTSALKNLQSSLQLSPLDSNYYFFS